MGADEVGSQAQEISLTLMERGGLLAMICGAGSIIGIVLGIMCESRVWTAILAIEAAIGVAGFLVGIVVWGSGWMLREE